MNEVRINGTTIVTHGKSVMISDGRVIIDGKDVTPEIDRISIEIVGHVENLDVDYCRGITVTGNVGSIETQSGSVQAGDVSGSVKTMSGSVKCGVVGGSVKTMSGSISHR